MGRTVVTAPGKVILFGEHAVVYGYPAIAAPVTQVEARVVVEDGSRPGTPSQSGTLIIAPDLNQEIWLADAPNDDALAMAIRLVQKAAGLAELPPLKITVSSTIPIASGLGSGAAIAAGLIRALARHLSRPELATNEQVSSLTYEVEKIYHGTPSGIDNTVVSYEQAVYFVRQQPQNRIETFDVARPVHLLVADTAIRSSTKAVVSDVRCQWEADPTRFDEIFANCGRIADEARVALEQGDLARLGVLMNENHRWCRAMTVSSPELDRLVVAAQEAGALGAKMSGAGRGGNMIALVTEELVERVRDGLDTAGARSVLTSVLV